jgi:transposase-like protein
MPRRRYTDDERATALAALAANGGNVARTAAQLGIPEKTLEHWSKGDRHPEAAKMGDQKRGPMADALLEVAWKLLDSIPAKIRQAPLNQTATAMGIALDKARLLRGEPTSITSAEMSHDHSLDLDPYADVFRNFARAVCGEGGPPFHANGATEPVHPPRP